MTGINSDHHGSQGERAGASPLDRRILRRAAAFDGLSEQGLSRLMEIARIRTVPEATLLFHRGDVADRFFIILDGWIKLFRLDPGGGEVVVMLFTAGEAVAQAAIFDEGRYPVSGQAVVTSRLLEIPAEAFLTRLQQDVELARAMFGSLSRRLRFLISEVERSRGQPCHRRLAELLLRMCPRDAGPVDLRLPLEKGLIAQRLGMTPATLSRAFARLHQYGVRTSGSHVHVEAVESLRAACCGRDPRAPGGAGHSGGLPLHG